MKAANPNPAMTSRRLMSTSLVSQSVRLGCVGVTYGSAPVSANAASTAVAEHLKDKLGWESVYAWNDEIFGSGGTLGRKDTTEAVLTRDLGAALGALTPICRLLRPTKPCGGSLSTILA